MRRRLPSPSLAVALALALLAPAVAYHVASTSAERELEPTSTPPPDLALDGPLSAPDAASIVQRYAWADATGARVEIADALVSVRTTRLVPPAVGVAFRLPGTPELSPESTLSGLLTVSEGEDGARRVAVKDGDATPFAAHVKPTGEVEAVWRSPDGETFRLRHAPGGAGVLLDANGDTQRFVLQDPVALLDDLPAPVTPSALVRVEETASGVRFTLLDHEVHLPGAVLRGDPFSPQCLTAVDGSGAGLLMACAESPGVDGSGFTRVGFEGPALTSILPGAESASVSVNTENVPFGVAVLTVAGMTEESNRLVLADAGTGTPLVTIVNDGDHPVLRDALADASTELAAAPVAFDVDTAESGLVVSAFSAKTGEEVARVDVDRRAPTAVTYRYSEDALGGGDPDGTLVVDAVTGLAASLKGDAASPSGLVLATTTGAAFFRAEPASGGGLRVSWPGAPGEVPVTLPAGRITVESDPSGSAPWAFRVGDGDAGFGVRVARESHVAGARGILRPVVTIDAPAGAESVTVAPPLAVTGDVGARRVDAVHVYSPADPSVSFLSLETGTDGVQYTTPLGEGGTADATGIRFPANALTGDLVVLQAGDLSVTMDRAAGTFTLQHGGITQHVVGPVAVSGDPVNPDALVVADPVTPDAHLLEYERNGGLTVLGEERAANTRLVTFEGDVRSPRGFSLVVRDTDGATQARYRVSPRAVLADAGAPGAVSEPLLALTESEGAGARFVAATSDARGNLLNRDALNVGTGALALAGPHTVRVEVPVERDAFTRVNLRAWSGSDAEHATVTPFVRVHDGEVRTYEATFAPPAADGGIVHLTVQYETELTPFASRTLVEEGYAYRVDGTGPRVKLQAAPGSATARFDVAWTGDADTAAFTVEKRAGDGVWKPWIAATDMRGVPFTGDPGVTYGFRARGLDALGNAGPWSEIRTVSVSPDADPSAAANLAARFTSPAPGTYVTGTLTIAWEVPVEPDALFANLYASRDGGRTWKALYSGTRGTFAWDTLGERDGDWTLRLVVTNGARESEAILGPVHVDNRAVSTTAAPGDDAAASRGSGDGGGATGDGDAKKGSGTLADIVQDEAFIARLALTGAGVVGAAILVVVGILVGRRGGGRGF